MFKIKNTETYNDICIIIKMMNPLMRKKIDSDFIDYLEKNKNTDYISKIDTSIPIDRQNIKYEVKVLLAVLYRYFLCSKKEKRFLEEKERNNSVDYNNELLKNIKNENILFSRKNKNYQANNNQNKTDMVVYKKDNWIRKLLKQLSRYILFRK